MMFYASSASKEHGLQTTDYRLRYKKSTDKDSKRVLSDYSKR